MVNKLLTEMSSSIFSQCVPTPCPMSRQFISCSALAFLKRGNHSNGAETSLPSADTTQSDPEVNDDSTTLGSTFIAKVSMPLFLK